MDSNQWIGPGTCLALAWGLLFAASLPAEDPTPSRTLIAGKGPVFVAFSPCGKSLVSVGTSGVAGRVEVKRWSVASGKATLTLMPDIGISWAVAFSPDGKSLAAARPIPDNASDDGMTAPAEIRLWDLTTGKTTAAVKGPPGIVWSLAYSPDSKALASAHNGGDVILWDVATGKKTATLPLTAGFFGAVAFSPDGKTLATGGGPVPGGPAASAIGELRLWDVATRKNVATFRCHPGHGCFSNMFAAVFSAAFSPDGKTLASGGSDAVELRDVATGKTLAKVSRPGDAAVVWRVAFSPDGKTLAATGEVPSPERSPTRPTDGGVSLLEVPSGKTLSAFTAHPIRVYSVAFSPDGNTMATSGEDGTIKLWDVARLLGPKAGQPAAVGPASPSGPEVMRRVAETYAKCRTYLDTGEVTAKYVAADKKAVEGGKDAARSFTTAFARPDRLRFEFKGVKGKAPWRLVTWADGKEVRQSWDLDPKRKRPESLASALSVIVGVTEGVSTLIPDLLMPRPKAQEPGPWKRLDDGAVGKADCFRVQGRLRAMNLEDGTPFDAVWTYWVEKKTFLIRRAVIRMEIARGDYAESTITLTPRINEEVPAKALEFAAAERRRREEDP